MDSLLARASLAARSRRRRCTDDGEARCPAHLGPAQRRALPSAARRAGLSDLAAVYGLAVVFVLVMVLFGLLRPQTFFSSININTVLVGQSVTAMLALAEMVPLATKQFDLSVGFHLGMAQILIIGLQVTGPALAAAAALIVLASLLVGRVNGLLVTRFGIDSFIATMGVGTLLYGVSNWYSGGEQIGGMDLPDSFTDLTEIVWQSRCRRVYVAVAAIVLWVVTERLPVGRSLYVIGASPRAAELTGIACGATSPAPSSRRACSAASPASCSAASWRPARRRRPGISAAGVRRDAAGRDLDPARPGQRGRHAARGADPGVLVLRRAAARRAVLRAVFLQRRHPDRGGRPVGLCRPRRRRAATARSRGLERRSRRMDPFEVYDPRFAGYTIPIVLLERLHTGMRWAEGPVYFADQRCLIFSDIPNNRMRRLDEESGAGQRLPLASNFSNGNTRDRQGRLITCEHRGRRVTRTEYDGPITVLADRYQGKRLNSPNDVVVKSDGTIWFTDPTYGICAEYEGGKAESEIGNCNVYRSTRATASARRRRRLPAAERDRLLARRDMLYIADSGFWPNPDWPHHIRAFDVADGNCTTAACSPRSRPAFRRLPRRHRRQHLDERRRRRPLHHARTATSSARSGSREGGQRLLRRPGARPALHLRAHIALRHPREHARRAGCPDRGNSAGPNHDTHCTDRSRRRRLLMVARCRAGGLRGFDPRCRPRMAGRGHRSRAHGACGASRPKACPRPGASRRDHGPP